MPVDALYDLTADKYDWAVKMAKNLGVQMFRIWGSGLLESDAFYSACNKYGIMVWQDFNIANFDTPEWPQEVWEAQVCQNIFRLRNQPSLAVWCGGNEFNPYSYGNAASMGILERNLSIFDPTRAFLRTSPDAGSMHSYPDFDPSCRTYLLESKFFINHYMVWTNTIYNASGTVFRKDALHQDYFKAIESFRYCGDWLFWTKIINTGKVIILKNKLNRFRLHNESTTAKAFDSGATAIETLNVLLNILPEVSRPRQLICYGTVHRNSRRTFEKAVLKSFNQYYFKHLGIFKGFCAIILERINKSLLHILPFTISQDKDIHIKPGTSYEV